MGKISNLHVNLAMSYETLLWLDMMTRQIKHLRLQL